MLLWALPLLLISSTLTSNPYQQQQGYYHSRIEYYTTESTQGYPQSRPYSAPEAMNQLTSICPPPPPELTVPQSQYSSSRFAYYVQTYPMNYSYVLMPVTGAIMTAPSGYLCPAPPAPVMLSNGSQDQHVMIANPAVTSYESTPYNIAQGFIKRGIYDSILHNCNFSKPSRTNINLESFIFDLQRSEASLSIPAETHLKWFVEFACSLLQINLHDNLCDYFEYIKEFHLQREIEINPGLETCIDNTIAILVQSRCIMPNVISQLVQMIGKGMSPQRANFLYRTLKTSILEHEQGLSKKGFSRYLIVLESFLEFIPQLPFHINSIDKKENSFGLLRIVLHFSYIYEILMAFRDSSPAEVGAAIYRMVHYSDGSLISNFAIEKFQVLDIILKRVFYRIANSNTKQMEIIFTRFEAVAHDFIKSILPGQIKTFIKCQMNNLLDFYIYSFTIENEEIDIDFVEYVYFSYHSVPADRYFSMHQIAIYLSCYEMTLSQFRSQYKTRLLTQGIDEDFVLVLETIIAATEDIDLEPVYYEYWEPSIEFLTLQSEIISRGKDLNSRYPIIDSPFLLLAAKIFLSRQTCFPISIFSTGPFYNDGFSWSDALNFVNFYFEIFFKFSSHFFKVKSKFFEDLFVEFEDSPTLDQMIYLHECKKYENLKKTIIDDS